MSRFGRVRDGRQHDGVTTGGPPGTKRNIVVMGDGFTAADQATFNTYVQTALMDGVFGRDYFLEDASAFNIYRINLESVDSGVSQRTWNEGGRYL